MEGFMEKLTPILSWNAPSHPKHNRTVQWYTVFFIIILGFAGYGAYTGNWTFAILMLLCGLIYPLLHDHTPPEKRIDIYPQGFLFADALTRWDDCTGFWLVPTKTYTELHVEYLEGKKQKEVKIQTGNIDTASLRLRLAEFIPELSNRGERLLDMIIRICKL